MTSTAARPINLPRVRRILRAIALALCLGAVVVAFDASNKDSAVRRGDFPAFYSMAIIANGSEPHRLYDLELQREIQNRVWPSMNGTVLPGAYPPYVAQVLRPLAHLVPATGKVLWTIISTAALLGSFWLLRYLNPSVRILGWDAAIALMIFSPILCAFAGAQNTCWSMFLYLAVIACHNRKSVWNDIAYGSALGLLLFKPQYALLAMIPAAVECRVVVISVVLLWAILCHLAGSALLGEGWLTQWMAFAAGFAEMNYLSNAWQMPNLIGGTRALISAYSLSEATAHLLIQGAVVVSGIGLFALFLTAIVDRLKPLHNHLPAQLSRYFLYFGPIVSLCTPQANFYDLGLAFVPLAILFNPQSRCDWRGYWILMLMAGAARLISASGGLPWYLLVSLSMLGMVFIRNLWCRRHYDAPHLESCREETSA